MYGVSFRADGRLGRPTGDAEAEHSGRQQQASCGASHLMALGCPRKQALRRMRFCNLQDIFERVSVFQAIGASITYAS